MPTIPLLTGSIPTIVAALKRLEWFLQIGHAAGPAGRWVLDRAIEFLIGRALFCDTLTEPERTRLDALRRHRVRKMRNASERHGWTWSERLEIVSLLVNAYSDDPQAQAVLKRLVKWLRGRVKQGDPESDPPPGPSPPTEQLDPLVRLEKLKGLFDQGVVPEAVYLTKREALLRALEAESEG